MKNPTQKSEFSKSDLRDYAIYRMEREMQRIDDYNKEDAETIDSDNEREPLSIDINKIVKIQLSWGGDGDGFKLTFDKDNDLIDGVYYWEDWGVYEEVQLTENQMDDVYNLYLYSDITAFVGC